MKLVALKCPGCNAGLEVEDDLDMCFCKYCGCKIILDGRSADVINAKVKMKNMDHKERLKDKEYEQERYRIKEKQKDRRHSDRVLIGMLVGSMCCILLVGMLSGMMNKKQNAELQRIVDEIIVDIQNEDYDSAYIKANTLHWDTSWSSDGEDKWNETRKAIIAEIEQAKNASKNK